MRLKPGFDPNPQIVENSCPLRLVEYFMEKTRVSFEGLICGRNILKEDVAAFGIGQAVLVTLHDQRRNHYFGHQRGYRFFDSLNDLESQPGTDFPGINEWVFQVCFDDCGIFAYSLGIQTGDAGSRKQP